MPVLTHKSGAVTGIKINTPHFKFWSAINEGGRWITFNLIVYKPNFNSKNRGLICGYFFGRRWNKFF